MLLESIPELFCDSKITELVHIPVIQAAVEALRGERRAGKIFTYKQYNIYIYFHNI